MLRIGRVKESVYKRSVEKQLHNDRGTSAPFSMKRVSVDGWTLAPERIFYNMSNAFYVCHENLAQLSVSLTMPATSEEADLRAFARRLGQLCEENHVFLTMDDIRVREDVRVPLIDASGISAKVAAEDPLSGSKTAASSNGKKSIADSDLIVVGTIACEGAAVLALEHEKELRSRFAGFYIEAAQHLFDAAAMPAVRKILEEQGLFGTAVREGGIFAGLWELAAACKVGLDIDLSAIPIRQHTVEICEYFNINPYMLLSGGCLLIVARHGEEVVSAFTKEGITANVIGRVTSGNDRIIHYDDEIRYLEPPKTDELYRMMLCELFI